MRGVNRKTGTDMYSHAKLSLQRDVKSTRKRKENRRGPLVEATLLLGRFVYVASRLSLSAPTAASRATVQKSVRMKTGASMSTTVNWGHTGIAQLLLVKGRQLTS